MTVRLSRQGGAYHLTGLKGLSECEVASACAQAFEEVPTPEVVVEGQRMLTTDLLDERMIGILYQRLG